MGGIHYSQHLGGLAGDADIGKVPPGGGFNGEYDDLQGPVSQGLGNTVLTYEQYRTAPFKAYFMRHDQNDELNYNFQMRHRWIRGTIVHLHVHFTGMSTWGAADPTKNVYWQVNYCWVALGVAVPDVGAGWTTVPVTMPVAKADQFEDALFELLDISPGAGAKESSIVRVQLIRLGTDPLDTYNDNKVGGTPAANLAMWDVDLHFQNGQIGTVVEFPP